MPRSIPPRRAAAAPTDEGAAGLDAAAIDALYGLEPLIEAGQDPRQRPLEATVDIQCPYCWQDYATRVDLSLGAQSFIEDCQHCCHAIEIHVELLDDGRNAQASTRRPDA